MSEWLDQHLPDILDRVNAAPRRLIALDYDGTLTPLIDDPAQATLDAATREVLARLADRRGVSVAVISGRELDDLRSMIDLPNLIYAGNHGLDIAGPGLRYVEPSAVAARATIGAVAEAIEPQIGDIGGARVENKVLTLSIHFRQVAPDAVPELRQRVTRIVRESGVPARIVAGHGVVEVRPQVDWHKGRAAAWIRDRVCGPDALVIYCGDDETDEDAFAALPRDVTIRVGHEATTAAHYRARDLIGISALLQILDRRLAAEEARP